MPRLPPSLIRRAHSISPHLAALLPVCRDLGSARHELRWIREHVSQLLSRKNKPHSHAVLKLREELLLSRLCRRRGNGTPLQYLLGSQPFGDLDIKCRPGVLIPRPETEAWVMHLAEIVRSDRNRLTDVNGNRETEDLRVLDLCLGSGCIALLLHSILQRHFPRLSVRGYDIESDAVGLARQNLAHNMKHGLLRNPNDNVLFLDGDIFAADWLKSLIDHGRQERGKTRKGSVVDVLVSNPPYISTTGFNRDTARSVRNHEPKRALVPLPSLESCRPDVRPEDVFYARLLEIAEMFRSRFAVFEVGDLEQARRVVQMAIKGFDQQDAGTHIEIWRDWPDMRPQDCEAESVDVGGLEVPVRGSGNGRAVFIHRTI
ncbi:S-adenosyl-L-methionine-dependent methyltransferase [Hypoxylon fuscum]|nr:S-adenosyl-L-methionine-dependent methyltransferase [Hypoxylon fuscum]